METLRAAFCVAVVTRLAAHADRATLAQVRVKAFRTHLDQDTAAPRRLRVPRAAGVSIALGLFACGSAPPPPVEEAPTVVDAPLRRATPARDVAAGVSLRTGFAPDPSVLRGQTTGTHALARLGEGCSGLSSETPTTRVELDSRFGFLRIFATSTADLTLAVRTADGALLCSDDRFGRHPSIEGRFPQGVLEIWVGVAGDTPVEAEFDLELTETRSLRPGVRHRDELDRTALAIEAGLDVRAQVGRQGDLRLRRGFLPEPRLLRGHTVVDARHIATEELVEGCVGRVLDTPDHVLTLADELDFLQVYGRSAPAPIVLLVLGPDGTMRCDTSEDELLPEVSANHWPAGIYRIWVGAIGEGASLEYELGVSETRRAL